MAQHCVRDAASLTDYLSRRYRHMPLHEQNQICDELVSLHLNNNAVTHERILTRQVVQILPLDLVVSTILGPLQPIPQLRFQVLKSLLNQARVVETFCFPPAHSLRQASLPSTLKPMGFWIEDRSNREEVRELHLDVKIDREDVEDMDEGAIRLCLMDLMCRLLEITDVEVGYKDLVRLTIAVDEARGSLPDTPHDSSQVMSQIMQQSVDCVRQLEVKHTRVMLLNRHKKSKGDWSRWDVDVGLNMTMKTTPEIGLFLAQMRDDCALWV